MTKKCSGVASSVVCSPSENGTPLEHHHDVPNGGERGADDMAGIAEKRSAHKISTRSWKISLALVGDNGTQSKRLLCREIKYTAKQTCPHFSH